MSLIHYLKKKNAELFGVFENFVTLQNFNYQIIEVSKTTLYKNCYFKNSVIIVKDNNYVEIMDSSLDNCFLFIKTKAGRYRAKVIPLNKNLLPTLPEYLNDYEKYPVYLKNYRQKHR